MARASLLGLGHRGARLQREAEGRPGAPDTYPDYNGIIAFKFGDEFVPAEDLRFVEWPEPAHHFDAAFSWIRHLGQRQGGGAGRGGGPGLDATKKEAANRTAHREAASSSLYEASQQVIVNSEDGQLQQLGDRVGGQSISLEPHRLQIYLPWPLPGPALRPRPTACDHTAGRGDEQGPSLARLRPPRLLRSQPSCISTS